MSLVRADVAREQDAALCEALAKEKPFCDKPWVRLALMTAAKAIRRGRLLTTAEKNENLALAFEEKGDKEFATWIRQGEK